MKVSLTGKVRDIFSIASLDLLCRARQATSGSSPIYAKKEMTVIDGHFLFGAGMQSKSEPFLLLIASCNSAKVMVFVPSL